MLAPSKKMAVPALLFLAAACAGNDITRMGPDANDLMASKSVSISTVTVTLLPATVTIPVGGTTQFTTTGTDKDGRTVTGKMGSRVKYRSSDTTVAKVSSYGIVKGVRNGTATITATYLSGTASATVTVGTGLTAPLSGSTSGTTSGTTTAPSTTTSGTSSTSTPSAQSGVGLSGLQMIGDDFTKYASTADLMAKVTTNVTGGTGTSNLIYTDGVNATLAEIDKTVTYNGHPTMKYNQPGGMAATPEMWVTLPKMSSHVWLRAHIRFSPGYSTTGTLTSAAYAYKLLGWGYAGTDGSGRLEITNTNQYDFYWGTTDRATNTTSGGGAHTNAGQINTEWQDGAWYTYIIEIDNTQPQGVTRFYWARGTDKPVLRGTTYGTMKDGSLVPTVPFVFLGMNFNQVRAADQNQALWYGDWEVVDANAHSNPFGM